MILSVFRVVLGLILACAAGALVKLGFADPENIFTTDLGKLSWTGHKVLLVGTFMAQFSAPFALLAAAIGEWHSYRTWVFYVLVGLAISCAGLLAIHSGEVDPGRTIANNYAVAAYLCSGLVAGLVYWLTSGRFAGDPPEPNDAAARTAQQAGHRTDDTDTANAANTSGQ